MSLQVYFTPPPGIAAHVIAALDAATTSLDVMAYVADSYPILDAIILAKNRGVPVRVVMDRENQAEYSAWAQDLYEAQIPVRIDETVTIMHCKVMVIDGHLVITGSYNWTVSAEDDNAENCLLIDDATTAAAYAANFETRWAVAQPYKPAPHP